MEKINTLPIVVFLDVDGVLNSQDHFERLHNAGSKMLFPQEHIDPQAVEILNELVPYVKFVLSSTWRHSTFDVEQLLKDKGFKGEIIDITPSFRREVIRGEEIKAWLDKNTVEQFVIIDDDSDMLPEQMPNFFQTDHFHGLTTEIVENIKRFLNV